MPITQNNRTICPRKTDFQIISVKGRTREKLSNSEIAGILTQNITESLKIKGRTLKTLIVPNEKDPEGSNSINGADDGIVLSRSH